MKAIVYYRSQPSEPDASNVALERQRAAVRRDVQDSGYAVVGEFVEREGEPGSEGYPAYIAAVEAACAAREDPDWGDVAVIVASNGAIGSGDPFIEPQVESSNALLFVTLDEPTIPHATEIPIPANAPGQLSLYAVVRHPQLDTLIYLCNAGPSAITDVELLIDEISTSDDLSSDDRESQDRWHATEEKRLDAVPARVCVQVNRLSHALPELNFLYRLRFTDEEGRRCMTTCGDGILNAWYVTENPDKVWVAFPPARSADEDAGNASA